MKVCNNEADYFDNGIIDTEINKAISEIEAIKENINNSYNSLDSRTRKKIQPFSYFNYDLAVGALNRLNNSRRTFAGSMQLSGEQMKDILQTGALPLAYDLTLEEYVTNEVEEMIFDLYNDERIVNKSGLPRIEQVSSLVDGIDNSVLANYRDENVEIYKKLIGMYSSLGSLTSQDLEQALRAGNCGRFNQNSHLGCQSFYSLDPNKLMVETSNKDENRYIKIGNKNWATLSTSGCGPSALYNCIKAYYPQSGLTVFDCVSATIEACGKDANEINFWKIPEISAKLGLNAEKLEINGSILDYDDHNIMQAIDSGKFVVASTKYKSGGHYRDVVGYKKISDKEVYFLILDSFNDNSDGEALFYFSDTNPNSGINYVKINNGAYAISPMENGEKKALAYHNNSQSNKVPA